MIAERRSLEHLAPLTAYIKVRTLQQDLMSTHILLHLPTSSVDVICILKYIDASLTYPSSLTAEIHLDFYSDRHSSNLLIFKRSRLFFI